MLSPQLWVASWRMLLMIFETIQVLVTLSADFALEGLLLFHAHRTGIWCTCLRVDDGERTVSVLVQLLCGMAVCFVVLQTVLVLVCLLAANDRTPERLVFFGWGHYQGRELLHHVINICPRWKMAEIQVHALQLLLHLLVHLKLLVKSTLLTGDLLSASRAVKALRRVVNSTTQVPERKPSELR